MSILIEARVPPALMRLIGPSVPLTEGFTLQLVTVGAVGFPHVAMLSCGEVVATDDERLALALWPGSTATVNLAEQPRAILTAIAEGACWTLGVEAVDLGAVSTPMSGTLRRFGLTVVRATRDEAPYALLESGVTFRLKDPPAARARWAQLRATLALPPRSVRSS